MICPTCHQSVAPRRAEDPFHGLAVAAHLYVTDVDRMLPLRGDTDIQRAANYADDARAARQERLRAALTDFCERANTGRPPFADERAIAYARSIVWEMIAEGTLDDRHRVKMLEGVRLAPDGKVTGVIASRFGGGVLDMGRAA